MSPSPLREWAKAVPFTPFTVTMSSGWTVQVTVPEMIILGKRWDTVAFVDEEGYDRTVLIRHSHINTIDAYDAAVQVPNAELSSAYFDSLRDACDDGAVSVVHGAWLNHSSTLARSSRLTPASALDMLVLYRAAAETFRDWVPGESSPEGLSPGGRVIHRDRAAQRLRAIADPTAAAFATRFANRVTALSEAAAVEQDLEYYVELFLRSIPDRGVIDGILSGVIGRRAKQLADPDLW